MLITLSRQFGAGASVVAQQVASALGWSVVDNEFVDEIARKAGLSADQVASREERVPSFGERLKRALAAAPDVPLIPAAPTRSLDEGDLVKATEAVVEEISRAGRVVLVGRAAVAVTRGEPDSLHVKLVAPKAFRIRVIMERLSLDEKAAQKLVADTDSQRERYHRDYYHRDWNDPVNYHMVLNTEAVGYAGATELIVCRARSLGW
jgi:cytidylate kinase